MLGKDLYRGYGGTQTNRLLREAFEKAGKLSEGEQDRIARLLLEEMESERRWDELFATPESEVFLERMAEEALAEHGAGLSEPLSLGDL